MRPAEFWALHPTEFYWLLEVRREPVSYGSLTEAQVAELYKKC
ncbi:hypothetical protein IZ6_07790 [Terrihabitans soli]|uniref:Phage tail assembly chaperone n=1 Tax=Terrihabitans soli TaxID=708113 RepID=A0A6S6QII8_9HYPH|nr:phage tail assembly chaperone [Terrihabitans soli]BCJ90044.1 hypothetical protein IZ6_07790 [Terrihabitans soli]